MLRRYKEGKQGIKKQNTTVHFAGVRWPTEKPLGILQPNCGHECCSMFKFVLQVYD